MNPWNEYSLGGPGSNSWMNAPEWFGFYYDFTTDEDATACVISAIASGTAATSDAVDGGALRIANNSTDENSGANFHIDAAGFTLAAGKTIEFKARLRTTTAAQADVWIGIFPIDTDLIGGVTDGLWFQLTDASASLAFNGYAGSASIFSKTGCATISDLTWFTVGIKITMDASTAAKGRVEAFVNGEQVYNALSTNLPASTVFLTGGGTFLSGAAAAQVTDIDYIGLRKQR
jgi:hypothetical protein